MKLKNPELTIAHLSIDVLEDQIEYLEKISIDNDDIFDVQLVSLKQLVLDLRKQLL